jgi:hypothetical protein
MKVAVSALSMCMAQRLASNFVKMARAVGSVDASTTVFLCCDIQERFRPIIRDFDKVVTASSMLMKGAQALRCPVIVTEQYPKGLGKTVEELVLHDGVEVFEKTAFSMMIEPVRHKIQSYGCPPPPACLSSKYIYFYLNSAPR